MFAHGKASPSSSIVTNLHEKKKVIGIHWTLTLYKYIDMSDGYDQEEMNGRCDVVFESLALLFCRAVILCLSL